MNTRVTFTWPDPPLPILNGLTEIIIRANGNEAVTISLWGDDPQEAKRALADFQSVQDEGEIFGLGPPVGELHVRFRHPMDDSYLLFMKDGQLIFPEDF